MKKILITGGPTNEPIDEVMKITNMSTGSLALDFANAAADNGCEVYLVVTESVTKSARFENYGFGDGKRAAVTAIETTNDMYNALQSLKGTHFDTIVHTSAVGDYRPEFSFRLEDAASEIAERVAGKTLSKEAANRLIMGILEEAPYRVKNDKKISSYEPNLTVKLGLTVKIISNLRSWFPDAFLVGCKLLENVEHSHLIDVAQKLCIKNDMDVIMANDLAELRNGQLVRYLVNKDGETGIALLQNGSPNLLEYARKEWF